MARAEGALGGPHPVEGEEEGFPEKASPADLGVEVHHILGCLFSALLPGLQDPPSSLLLFSLALISAQVFVHGSLCISSCTSRATADHFKHGW